MSNLKHSMVWLALAAVCGVAHGQPPAGQPAVESDPAVLAALELPRTEPSHYVQAVLALINLQRPELAAPIMKELSQLQLNDDERADLVEEFGSRRMLRLAQAEALAPEGGAFAEACMAAAAARHGLSSQEAANQPPQAPDWKAVVATADAATLSDMLAKAIKQHESRAAAAMAEAIGSREDVSVLWTGGPRVAPLVDALVYPDRRVRFAALGAILALDPQVPFPGSSRVPTTLGFFAAASGERRAVVAMPITDHATTLAGRLTGIGITAEPVARGAAAVKLARKSADLEFVLVDVDIQSAGIRDVLYALRSDPATGRIPIGLLATSSRLDFARRLASEHDWITVFSRPQTDQRVNQIAETLGRLPRADRLPADEQAQMASQARAWLGQLLARPATIYDLTHEAPLVEAANN